MEKKSDNLSFEELLMDSDVRYYLKASPFEAGERSQLDTALTEEYYYQHLYAHSPNAQSKIEDIQTKIKTDNVHNFILAGYKGCGKSTFVRYLLREMGVRHRVINLDDYWDPDKGIKNNLVAYLDRLIENDLFPTDGQEPCRVIQKYIDLFCGDAHNKYELRGIDTENYLIYFGDKIEYSLVLSKSGNNEELREYFETDIKIHILKGAEVNGTRFGATISNILTLILFWDIAYRIAYSLPPKCCIVFENLDVIYNTKDIPQFAEHVIAFRNNVDKLVPNLIYERKNLSNPTQDYILIFVMRETTEGEFAGYIEHFSDKKVFFQPYTDISDIYDIQGIINKRAEWLKKISESDTIFSQNQNIKQIKKKSNLILQLVEDQYLRKKLFGLFNNDYRTFVEILSAINFEDSHFFCACNTLLKLDAENEDDWAAYGYRSVIYREILNIFVKAGYISKLMNFEYSVREAGRIRSINVVRMILMYLSNSVTNCLMEDDKKEWKFVPLDELFSEIMKFCHTPELVVGALWQMYDLRRESKWNHLITFENMCNISKEELQREIVAYQNKTSGVEYGKVKITLAGENYINHILPNFELYAARAARGNGYSLFSLSAEEWCDFEKINTIFKEQRKVIRDCCYKLFCFYTDILHNIPEFRENAFLQSKFAATKFSITRKNISKMYHSERIIHASIGYVDRLRFYVFNLMDTVLEKNGFEKEVNIKDILAWLPNVDASIQAQWSSKVQLHRIKECILPIGNPEDQGMQKVIIRMENRETVEQIIPFKDCILMIKACINAKLVDVIKNYIRLFGIRGLHGISPEKQSVMHSMSTEKLCEAFAACISDVIVPSGYTDFETHINLVTGNKIIHSRNQEEKYEKDKARHEKSRNKYNKMKQKLS